MAHQVETTCPLKSKARMMAFLQPHAIYNMSSIKGISLLAFLITTIGAKEPNQSSMTAFQLTLGANLYDVKSYNLALGEFNKNMHVHRPGPEECERVSNKNH